MKSKKLIIFLSVSIMLLYIAVVACIVLINKTERPITIDTEEVTKKPQTTTEDTTKAETTAEDTTKTETQSIIKTKKVAFTFDDGPHIENTKKFVNILKSYNGAATFFVVGNRINSTTGEAIKYAFDNGCQVQVHAYTHSVMFDICSEEVYQEELDKTEKAIKKYINCEMKLMRPPGGRISNERLCACKYSVIMWSVDSRDWEYKNTKNNKQENINIIVDKVLSNVHDGDIVLMHEIYQNSYEAFCIIAAELNRQGYKFVTVEELLGESIQVGQVYRKIN